MRNDPLLPDKVGRIASERGASACGMIRAAASEGYAGFRTAAAGAPPGLGYLLRTLPCRSDIRNWFPSARSVLLCAFRYWGEECDHSGAMKKAGEPLAYLERMGHRPRPGFLSSVKARGLAPKISRYALGPDYHRTVKEKLSLMLADIRSIWPDTCGKPFTDSSPVLEKEMGRLAGLGFRGRNTLLISPEFGSYFFIGGLALSRDFSGPEGLVKGAAPGREGGCGTCRKCVDACPTGALGRDGLLDAGKCVSYWNTQAGEPVPEGIINRSAGYIYGCDICQEVCPYNRETGRS